MLKMKDISYTYPQVDAPALQRISLHITPGKMLLCTGESGCGKSTLIRLMNGLLVHHSKGKMSGDAYVKETNVRDVTPSILAETVGSLFQEPERQFFTLTVAEEIAFPLRWRNMHPDIVMEKVMRSAERIGITDLLPQTIFGLSEGQKQKVALAALLACEPHALLLDEPSANLDPESTVELASILLQLKNDGMALLVVDHRLSWLRDVADEVLVLEQGKEVARGAFSILDDTQLASRYGLRSTSVTDVRATLPDKPSRIPTSDSDSLYTCSGLGFAYTKEKTVFTDVTLAFEAGERIALIGDNGAGKTTLARLMAGLEKPTSGKLTVRGKKVPRRQLARHAQIVLQNASHQLRMQSVAKELDDAAMSVFPDKTSRLKKVQETMQLYGLSHLALRHPQSLSGGEKQRLAVAAATIRSPEMLVLDEPTSGLDGRNMQRMAEMIHKIANDGAAVVVITHDLELMALCCSSAVRLTRASSP